MIGTPAHDWKIDVRFADSLVQTIKLCAAHEIDIIPIYQPGDALIQRARNDLVKMALEGGVDDLFFIDSDQFWKPEWFLALLSHPVNVVGAAVRKKADREEEYNVKAQNGVIPVDELTGLLAPRSVGTGFLRVSRTALQAVWALSEPYVNNDGSTARMVFDVKVIEGKLWSEDTLFCAKLIQAGIPIHLDASFTVPHVGQKVYEGDFATYIDKLAKAEAIRSAEASQG